MSELDELPNEYLLSKQDLKIRFHHIFKTFNMSTNCFENEFFSYSMLHVEFRKDLSRIIIRFLKDPCSLCFSFEDTVLSRQYEEDLSHSCIVTIPIVDLDSRFSNIKDIITNKTLYNLFLDKVHGKMKICDIMDLFKKRLNLSIKRDIGLIYSSIASLNRSKRLYTKFFT